MKIIVYPSGLLVVENRAFRCALGRGGIANNKIEGDGATPAGEFKLRKIFYRQDRLECPKSSLSLTAIRPEDRWSDDPTDPNYNHLVQIPHAFKHETLWRDDSLYDIIVPLDTTTTLQFPGWGAQFFYTSLRINMLQPKVASPLRRAIY